MSGKIRYLVVDRALPVRSFNGSLTDAAGIAYWVNQVRGIQGQPTTVRHWLDVQQGTLYLLDVEYRYGIERGDWVTVLPTGDPFVMPEHSFLGLFGESAKRMIENKEKVNAQG